MGICILKHGFCLKKHVFTYYFPSTNYSISYYLFHLKKSSNIFLKETVYELIYKHWQTLFLWLLVIQYYFVHIVLKVQYCKVIPITDISFSSYLRYRRVHAQLFYLKLLQRNCQTNDHWSDRQNITYYVL